MALATARHFRPRRAVPRSGARETRVDTSWIESLLSEAVRINQQTRTFVRATSAYDPISNSIVPPGVCRQRYARYRDRSSILMDLIEGPRTNLLAAGSSDTPSQATYPNAVQITFTPNAANGPDGSASLALLARNSVTGNCNVGQVLPNNVTAGLPYTLQAYVRKGTIGGNFGLRIQGAYPNRVDALFNLNTGALIGAAVGGTWTAPVGTIKSLGGGLYLVSVTGTASATETGFAVFGPTGSTSVGSWEATDGALDNCYAGWLSLEQAAFPSSFISNRNLLLHSGDLSNAVWSQAVMVATANQAADPYSGLTNIAKLTEANTTNAYHGTYQTLTKASASLTYTVQYWVKAAERTQVQVQIADGGFANGAFAFYDLSAGVVHSSSTYGTGFAVLGTNITAKAGGYVVSLTASTNATNTVITQVAPSVGWVANYAGVVGSGFYAGDAQLEYGTTATNYWGTNATVGGRDADDLSVSLAGLPGGGLSTTQGTLMALVVPYGWTNDQDGVTVWEAFRVEGAQTTLSVNYNNRPAGIIAARSTTSGQPYPLSAALPSAGNLTTYGLTWDTGFNERAFGNGIGGTALGPGGGPYTANTQMTIGNNTTNGNRYFNGWVCLEYGSRAWSTLEHSLFATNSLVLGAS